ncbi:MAG: HlyD family efflux transporter periplasmic adaptor subunit [Myxococcales bacterium]|nr:HlyD family efflux transporter periplasmic adaptor subunit [Myxococcales bacterium]
MREPKLLVLASAAAALVLGLGCNPGPPALPPGYQGILEYEERTLAFELPGHLKTLNIDEGQELAPGDEIARLDDTLEVVARGVQEAQAKAVRARVTLLEAGARKEDLAMLRAEISAAKSSEQLTARTLSRQQELADKGVARPADLDAASSAATTAVARRRELEQQLARALHGARPEEVDVAVAEAEAAEAAIKSQDERIARHVLRSEHVGTVLEVHHEEGEFVGVGAPIATLADLAHPYVDVFVPQGQIDEARVGREATVHIDALEADFAGRVEWIGRRTEFTPKFLFSERERPNLVVRVRVRVDDPEHLLRAGVPTFVTWVGDGP